MIDEHRPEVVGLITTGLDIDLSLKGDSSHRDWLEAEPAPDDLLLP